MLGRISTLLGAGAIAVVVGAQAAMPASEQTKLLRFPDIHGDRVVFSYAGDLWLASTEGGAGDPRDRPSRAGAVSAILPRRIAHRLHRAVRRRRAGVRHPGVRRGAAAASRTIRRRGPAGAALGLRTTRSTTGLPTGGRVLFRSLRYSTDLSDSRLFLASADGGLPVPLPMPESGAGDLSPDGSRVVYSPLFRDFRTWKRYEGGWAQELYIFDRETHVVERGDDASARRPGPDVDR